MEGSADLSRLLCRVWEQQEAYNQRVKQIQDRSTVEWTETYLLGLVSEVGELLRECNWKKHRLKSSKDFGPNVPEELADLTKFVVCLWQNLGYGPEEMLQACYEKGLALDQKFQQEHRPEIVDRSILILDLDGSVADFRSGFETWVKQHPEFGKSLPVLTEDQMLTLHMDVNKNWPFAEYTKAKLEFEQSGGYGRLPAYENLIRSLSNLQRNDDLYIVVWTARPGKQLRRVWMDTWNWMLQYGLQPDEFHFGGDERIADAVRLADAGNDVIALDDNLELSQRYLANHIPVVLVDQPYNQGYVHERLTRITPGTSMLHYVINNTFRILYREASYGQNNRARATA